MPRHFVSEDQISSLLAVDDYSYVVTEYEGYSNVADIGMEKDWGKLSNVNLGLLPEFTFQDDVDGTADGVIGSSMMMEMRRADERTATSTAAGDGENDGNSKSTFTIDNKICTGASCCAVCINNIQPGEVITCLLPCNHAFHKECIVPWLKNYKGFCPLCMEKVDPKRPSSKNQNGSENQGDGRVKKKGRLSRAARSFSRLSISARKKIRK